MMDLHAPVLESNGQIKQSPGRHPSEVKLPLQHTASVSQGQSGPNVNEIIDVSILSRNNVVVPTGFDVE